MKKKAITLLLALTVGLSTLSVGCADKEAKVDTSNAPDYSGKTGQFVTYGYHSPVPAAAFYDENGDVIDEFYDSTTGALMDFRTVERYKEYLDCGLNTMFLQANDAYGGGNYGTSQLKKNFQTARDAGIDKVIICDSRLHTLLCETTEPIIGTAETATQKARFAQIYGNADGEKTIEDLTQVVRGWLKDYIHEDNFYGVLLKDEPTWQYVPQVAAAYKATKAAFPLAKADLEAEGVKVKANDIFVQLNLLPAYGYDGDGSSHFVDKTLPENQGLSKLESFEKYVSTYMEASGADNITMDTYPMKQTGRGEGAIYSIEPMHFVALQTFAELTKGKDITMGGVSCTCEFTDTSGMTIKLKGPTKSDMYYQLNSYMMFGFTSFSYYTYWAKTSGADTHTDGTSFINRDGSKGVLYDVMTDIHAEMQAMAPTLMQYKYVAANYYKSSGALSYAATYLNDFAQAESFAKLESVTTGTDQVCIVTELYDDEKQQNMYAIMNTQAPGNANYSAVGLDAKMKFDDSCKAVKMLYQGETYVLPLEDGELNVSLPAGGAAYIMPF